ncbi:hypothetical protein MHM84_01230 [Halomonas sp. McH1-25]|uniref:hypothetical protein n=1 Tax=unclassified Halomonas TaxID=2609666 RepID=UPI001EF70AE7|nr:MULTISPECIES: hypothetical protein [unclassified Halomonas]MCG7598404.1 hypothetical protein [Halomonas sp. McH1-25]MCP1342654.1 hypothetical protein [Halomonas sp. FL8]MCP1361719.1 hypothetical protein [Halomonas sp. BBD45]MCP1363815.1 hypothetical protein [Halomonas sp. BBD48]
MSEQNIDTMSREELEATASDLGIKVTATMKDETLVAKIHEALGDAPLAPAPTATEAHAPGEEPKAKRFKIIVATHDQDKQPVQVGVNGRTYVIERGKEVTVPESVVEVLRNAVQHVHDPKTMEENKVMAYPFQIMSEA